MPEANVCSYQAMRGDPDLGLLRKMPFPTRNMSNLGTLPQPFSSTSSHFTELSYQCLFLTKHLLKPLTRSQDATILHSPHPNKGKQNALQPVNLGGREKNNHHCLYLTDDIRSTRTHPKTQTFPLKGVHFNTCSIGQLVAQY